MRPWAGPCCTFVAPAQGPALSRAEVRLALDEARRSHEPVIGEMSVVAEVQDVRVTRVASR